MYNYLKNFSKYKWNNIGEEWVIKYVFGNGGVTISSIAMLLYIGGNLFGLINNEQLSPLGITNQHVYIFMGLIGIIIFYYLLTPLVKLTMVLEWHYLITYLLGSLILLLLLVLSQLVPEESVSKSLTNIANFLLGISIFGLGLFIIRLSKTIATNVKRQRSKSL